MPSPRTRRRRIIAAGHNTWRVPRASQAGLIVDAKDYYLAFYRAALEAKQYILLSGWQFDRGVPLLRDEDVVYAQPAGGEVQLLKFLNHLCETRPALQVYILAWDFHMVFALEREWMQRIYFHWATHERLHFHFDGQHMPGGCHHQKFVVIDGRMSFLGGIDLCEARWDDRRHLGQHPSRLSRGAPQKPYHDIQGYFTGRPVADALAELFCDRWALSGAEPIALPRPRASAGSEPYRPRGALPFPAGPFALSRTQPCEDKERSVHEIRSLLEEALVAAESLVYIETQYFSSRRLCLALEGRMREAKRGTLEIVLILNQRAEAVKEEIAVGLRQAENIERLRKVAAETGHALGAYYSVADGLVPDEKGVAQEKATYIHSKLTLIDDRFLSMGSTNLTNRSLDLDSELNASWEVRPTGDAKLERAIRRARVSLLAEHLGEQASDIRALARVTGLVAHLDGLVKAQRGRLRAMPPPTADQARALEILDPQALPFDPEAEDQDGEAQHQRSLFRVGISELWDKLTAGGSEGKVEAEPPPRS